MCKALNLAAVAPLSSDHVDQKKYLQKHAFILLQYLLKKGVFKASKLIYKPNRYASFLFKLDWRHIIYILYKDATNIQFLPRPIRKAWSILWRVVQAIWWTVWAFKWFFYGCNKILGLGGTTAGFLQGRDEAIADVTKPIHFFVSIRGSVIFFILCACKVIYDSIQLTHPPGYLFYLFKNIGKKNKSAVEAIGLLLLEQGAYPTPKPLFVKKQMSLAQGPQLYTYATLSLLHLAAKHDMLLLSKELIKRGADTNAIATSAIKDIQHKPDLKYKDAWQFQYIVQEIVVNKNLKPLLRYLSPNPYERINKLKNTFLKVLRSLEFITTKDLKKLKKGNKATPLDMAPKGSVTARYLRACRGKNYRDIKAFRKNNKRKRKNLHKKTGKKEASKVA